MSPSTRAVLWFEALRPRTWPASLAPVLVGSAAAFHAGGFVPAVAALACATALLLQISTNLVNDWGDHVRGADGEDRIGPARASQSGGVDPRHVALAGGAALAAAAAVGALLIVRGGWPVVWIGLGSLVAAVAYTAGPFPLAYHGLGEVFVFAFFGPVAVLGTEYVQAGVVSDAGVAASIAMGALAAAILLVNNVRDVDGDARAGKRTIVVRLGRRAGRALYAIAVAIAFGGVIGGGIGGWLPRTTFAVLLALPLVRAPLSAVLTRTDGASLNAALAATARLELVFGVLLAAGLVW